MKVSELLEQRRKDWRELERLCDSLEGKREKSLIAGTVTRFASLYRAACADLALANEYRLPQNTVNYLHQLVGRAHNQLYRSHRLDTSSWREKMLVDVPGMIFHDRCVQTAFLFFWSTFLLSAFLSASDTVWPEFAEQVLATEQVEMMEENFGEPLADRPPGVNLGMAAFYIWHNTRIGLQCFAGGLLVIPGLIVTLFNAVSLGAAFGYFARSDVAAGVNFYEFVTAHGPFELTAIVLCAGAGLRLGISWIKTDGLTRTASIQKTAHDAMPLMSAAVVLFFLAALIEAFVSPSSFEGLAMIMESLGMTLEPYVLKACVAVICSGALMFYFVILGYRSET